MSRATAILAFGVSCGVMTGLLHALILKVTQVVFGQMIFVSRDFVWMAPVVYVGVMLPGVVALAVASLLTRWDGVYRLTVMSCLTVGVFGLLLPYPQISRLASLVLALGAAIQIGRIVGQAPESGIPLWRKGALAAAPTLALLALIVHVASVVRSQRARGDAAVAADAPNVLFIVFDTMRAASMGLYGAAENSTPRLQEWAEQGVTFDRAYSTAPWTLPSHGSMFTGRYGGETSGDWTTPINARDSTLAEVFGSRGYATGGFVANMHYTSHDSGLNRGFHTYSDYLRSPRQLLYSSSYTQTRLFAALQNARSIADVWSAVSHPDLSIEPKHRFDHKRGEDVTAEFLQWRDGIGSKPFFAFLNYMDAHKPYFAPDEFQRFTNQPQYSAAIAYLDSQVDRILADLSRDGILEQTVVVITSDHGELFDEHGLSGHAHNVYHNVLHVPLVLLAPGRIPAGIRVGDAVSLRDLAATVLHLANATESSVPGVSLAQQWLDTIPTSPVFSEVSRAPNVAASNPTALGPLHSLIDDSLHYITNSAGSEQLYSLRVDRTEMDNLAVQSEMFGELMRRRVLRDSLLAGRSDR